MTVRPVHPDDVPGVVDWVRELAEYEPPAGPGQGFIACAGAQTSRSRNASRASGVASR